MDGGGDRTLVLRVGYRGAGFSGFAEQPGQRTVAGELLRSLEILLRRPVELTCAGRTDAGVSALGQYVSVPLRDGELEDRDRRSLMRSLMALTPDDLSIGGVFQAAAGFSARFDALSRTYRYRIATGNTRPVMAWEHCWWCRSELDTGLMEEASACLVGEHDFASFCKGSSAAMLRQQGRSTSRCIERLSVGVIREAGEELVAVDVRGNAFLHNMVRIMVGTLVEVGRGHRPAEWVGEVLEARQRAAAGPTAPARGLTFQDVDFPPGALLAWP